MIYQIATGRPADKIPILKGFIVKDVFYAWCPFCRKWHNHSAQDGELAHKHKSHRAAHCANSPLNNTGYYLRLFTKTELRKLTRLPHQ